MGDYQNRRQSPNAQLSIDGYLTCLCFCWLESGARRHVWTTWVVGVDSPWGTVRNNLHRDILRLCASLIAHVMEVPTAYVGEALACAVGREGAIVVVDRERSLYHCDQAGTRMSVPPSLAPRLEDML